MIKLGFRVDERQKFYYTGLFYDIFGDSCSSD